MTLDFLRNHSQARLRLALAALGFGAGLGYSKVAGADSCTTPAYEWELELESVALVAGGAGIEPVDLEAELERLGETATLRGDFTDDHGPEGAPSVELHGEGESWWLSFERTQP